MTDKKTALILLNDLMFQVKIAEAAKHADVRTIFVDSETRLSQSIQRERPDVIVLDINLPSVDPLKIIRNLKGSAETQSIPLLGYIAHVQVELRTTAVEAGCDVVLARSTFVQKLPELLTQYSLPSPSTLE